MCCANIDFLVLTVVNSHVKCHHWEELGKSTWDFSVLFLQFLGSPQFFTKFLKNNVGAISPWIGWKGRLAWRLDDGYIHVLDYSVNLFVFSNSP